MNKPKYKIVLKSNFDNNAGWVFDTETENQIGSANKLNENFWLIGQLGKPIEKVSVLDLEFIQSKD